MQGVDFRRAVHDERDHDAVADRCRLSVIFGTEPDADLNGDGFVNFVDLGVLKGSFFLSPGTSGVPNGCDG